MAFEASLQFDDPINIQFTSGTTGAPKGATLTHHNILNNGYFIGEAMRLTPDDRLCIPVPYYHCFGMVLGNLACVTHGSCMVSPSEGFDPVAALETVAGRTMHRPAWRAHDVHRHARTSRIRAFRPQELAHRDHGGLALPGRSDAKSGQHDAHERSHHCLWHDGNEPSQLPERLQRPARAAGLDGRPHPAASRSQDCRLGGPDCRTGGCWRVADARV